MAMLSFKGETLTVKVTHNVISELIRLTDVPFQEAIKLAHTDPYGWARDVVYCSLRVYNPAVLGEMTKFEIGDEISKLPNKDFGEFLTSLLNDFVLTINDSEVKEVASEKK